MKESNLQSDNDSTNYSGETLKKSFSFDREVLLEISPAE
jgi:hypothetical protein